MKQPKYSVQKQPLAGSLPQEFILLLAKRAASGEALNRKERRTWEAIQRTQPDVAEKAKKFVAFLDKMAEKGLPSPEPVV